MKKLLIIAIVVLGLSSCSESYPIRNSPDSMANQFINLERITEDNLVKGGVSIFRDKHTDVLYFVFITKQQEKCHIFSSAVLQGIDNCYLQGKSWIGYNI